MDKINQKDEVVAMADMGVSATKAQTSICMSTTTRCSGNNRCVSRLGAAWVPLNGRLGAASVLLGWHLGLGILAPN